MENKKPERESDYQCNQKLPKGHFSEDGLSQGKAEGAVRKTPDAYNETRKEK